MRDAREEESVARPGETRLWSVPTVGPFSLALHGGAGGRIEELSAERREPMETGARLRPARDAE